MRIKITHDTLYRYELPVRSVIQMLRLTPRDHSGQHVLGWRIEPDTDGRIRSEEDGLGNLVHVFAVDGPVQQLSIRVTGEVETVDTGGVISNAVERVPDLYYLRDTPLSLADDAICGFADDIARHANGTLAALHDLLAALHSEMTFDIRPTDVGTTAAEAFRLKRGVCQDLTHVFIAAARRMGVPTRYVSGYFLRNDGVVEQDAGHAWAEAKVPELGWVGFDPANGICSTQAHVRVAVALDYLGAAPVRGARRGGGTEALDVKLRVDTAQRHTQG
jgi:transglutaminase-like putative cysteine protease